MCKCSLCIFTTHIYFICTKCIIGKVLNLHSSSTDLSATAKMLTAPGHRLSPTLASKHALSPWTLSSDISTWIVHSYCLLSLKDSLPVPSPGPDPPLSENSGHYQHELHSNEITQQLKPLFPERARALPDLFVFLVRSYTVPCRQS